MISSRGLLSTWCFLLIITMSTQINNKTLIEKLFSVGAHFGFNKSRRHPSISKFLYGTKEGNDIFDLEQTASSLDEVKATLKEATANGKTILFVGTKSEVINLVKSAAERVEMPYVVNRWIGGMLTNQPEIRKRINKMEELIREKESGEAERKYTKKERVLISRDLVKLNHNFFGISKMNKAPDFVFIIDSRHDAIALTEAQHLGIKTIALMSSDCNATNITYPIMANDSLQASIKLVLEEVTEAILEGKKAFVPKPVATKPEYRPRAPRA